MSAHFNQTSYVKKQPAKNASGHMALQRPGKFRWEITQPNRQIIIADGQYLWIYDVDLEQATRQSLNKDVHSPAILLSGSSQAIEQRFTLIHSERKGQNSIFQLKPKNNQDLVQQVELKFTHDKLSEMSVMDSLGQKNTFQFTDVKLNPSLPNSLFQFKAPKGVDIIKN